MALDSHTAPSQGVFFAAAPGPSCAQTPDGMLTARGCFVLAKNETVYVTSWEMKQLLR